MNSITKKDVIVMLACVFFLLATLGAAGTNARSRAKNLVCLSNLHQWGAVFNSYTSDHDGYFNGVYGAEQTGICRLWMNALHPYYGNSWNLLLCPAAIKVAESPDEPGTFRVWSYNLRNCYPAPGEPSLITIKGSYSINSWTNNYESGSHVRPSPWNWKNVNGVQGKNNIPVFADSTWFDSWPQDYDTPPPQPDAPTGDYGYTNEMRHFCIDRHNNGTINMLFMDWSARKVGLKELWTLKWHRNFNTENSWTLAGCNGNLKTYNARWNAAAPWMKDFEAF